jgi:hypothetical protein
MEVYKKHGTKERLFEMMNNVNKKILKEHINMDEPSKRDFDDKEQVSVKEDFNYNDAERDQQGQQDMQQHEQDKETSRELASILHNDPKQFGWTILNKDLQYIPAYVKTGGLGMHGTPDGLGFRDLEKAGMIVVAENMPGWGGEDDGDTEITSMTVTSDLPIYGIDTGKTYKKGDRIE